METAKTLREHILSLHGLRPDSTRTVEVRTYSRIDGRGFPMGSALSVERIDVTAWDCFDSEGFWNVQAAAQSARRRYDKGEFPYIAASFVA